MDEKSPARLLEHDRFTGKYQREQEQDFWKWRLISKNSSEIPSIQKRI